MPHPPQVDILLANPLRLSAMAGEDAEGGRKVDLSAARFLVLDEADKLFEMGFMEQVCVCVCLCGWWSGILRGTWCCLSCTVPCMLVYAWWHACTDVCGGHATLDWCGPALALGPCCVLPNVH